MPKFLKWIFGIVASLLVLFVVAVVVLIFFVDPNRFKPDIIAQAQKQGMQLTLDGAIAWQFYPDIGFIVNQVSVAPTVDPSEIIASIQQAALSVKLIPLFSGNVSVNGITLAGLDANLNVNEEGIGNWQQFSANQPADSKTSMGNSGKQDVKVAIHSLDIIDSQVTYFDGKTRQKSQLSHFYFNGKEMSLDEVPFALSMKGDFSVVDVEQKAQKGRFDIQGMVAVNKEVSRVSLKDTKVILSAETVEQKQTIDMTMQMDALLPHAAQKLQVNSMELNDANITSSNTVTKQTISMSHLSFSAKTMAMNSVAFPVKAKGAMTVEKPEQPKMTADFDFSGNVAMDEKMNNVAISAGKTIATISTDKGKGNVDITMDINAVKEPMSFVGQVSIAPTNGRDLLKALGKELPPMQSATALTKMGFSADVAGTENTAEAKNMTMQIDEAVFTGSIVVSDISKQAVDMTLRADAFNLDNYMAPVVVETTPAAAATGVEEDPVMIPVETLKPLQMKADIQIGKLTAKKMPFTDFKMQSSANAGLLTMKSFTSKLYDGSLSMSGSLDVKSETPAMQFDMTSKQIPVGKVLKAMAIDERISGSTDVSMVGKTSGLRKSELLKALDAKLLMSGKEFQVANINVEKTVCEMASKFDKNIKPVQAWDNFTQMRDMSLKGTMKDGVATIETMEGGIEQIALKNTGKLNVLDKSFDMHLTTRITDAMQGVGKCTVTSKQLLNRDIPIRCKGSFDKIGPLTCLPDMSFIENIAKDALKLQTNELKLQANDKLNEAIKAKLGGEEGVNKAKDLLKGLFQKK